MSKFGHSFYTTAKSILTFGSSHAPEYRIARDKLAVSNYFPVLSWTEKVVLIVDYFQLFGLLWITAQPWPWPFLWITYSRPLLYLNLDFFSLTNDGALAGRSNINISRWGSMENYIYYAIPFVGIQFLVFASIFLVRPVLESYGKRHFEMVDRFEATALIISYLLYLPCSLTVFRLYYCEPNTNDLSVDPTLLCFGLTHTLAFTFCTSLCAPSFIGLPIMIYSYVQKGMIYADKHDHEKRTQMWEILYMLGLDDHWIRHHLWTYSSFTLFGSYFRVHMLLYKAFLLLIFTFVRTDLTQQSVLFIVATYTFCGYYTFYNLPYRCNTTNAILLIVLAMHVVNATFGMVSSFNVKSAIMVSSTQSLLLVTVNGIGFLSIIAVLVYTSITPILDWPALRTLKRIRNNKKLAPKVVKWIETIYESKVVKMDFLLTPIEIADINSLEESIRELRACWLSARTHGSIFETPLSDALTELMYIHATSYPHALRKHAYWDEEYMKLEDSQIMAKREERYRLMAPRKRRLLTKMLAYRFLRGDRGGNFDMKLAMRNKLKRKTKKEKQFHRMTRLQKFQHRVFNNHSHVDPFGDDKSDNQGGGVEREGEESEGDLEEGSYSADGSVDSDEGDGGRTNGKWPAGAIDEAAAMIKRLQQRSEMALTKFDNGTGQIASAAAEVIADASHRGLERRGTEHLKIATAAHVDEEEQKDLEELYLLWDEAIQLQEIDDFPGDPETLNKDVENWYTYRGLIAQRLEIIASMLVEEEEFEEEEEEENEQEREGDQQGRQAAGGEDFRGKSRGSADLEEGGQMPSPRPVPPREIDLRAEIGALPALATGGFGYVGAASPRTLHVSTGGASSRDAPFSLSPRVNAPLTESTAGERSGGSSGASKGSSEQQDSGSRASMGIAAGFGERIVVEGVGNSAFDVHSPLISSTSSKRMRQSLSSRSRKHTRQFVFDHIPGAEDNSGGGSSAPSSPRGSTPPLGIADATATTTTTAIAGSGVGSSKSGRRRTSSAARRRTLSPRGNSETQQTYAPTADSAEHKQN